MNNRQYGGGVMPNKIKNFIKKSPRLALNALKLANKHRGKLLTVALLGLSTIAGGKAFADHLNNVVQSGQIEAFTEILDGLVSDNPSSMWGSGLALSGGNVPMSGHGLKLSGQGWKTKLGATLIGLSVLGTPGAMAQGKVEGLIGGAVMGSLGGLLIHLDKKKKGGNMRGSGSILDKHLMKNIKALLKKKQAGGAYGSGKNITNKHVKDFLNEHKNVEIHISDILGPNWKKKGAQLYNMFEQAHKAQIGGNIFGDMKKGLAKVGSFAKKTSKQALNETKRFLAGKTKLKPSKVLSYAAGAVGVVGAASALIPGVNLISAPVAGGVAMGLSGLSKIAAVSGRGHGSGLFDILPKKYHGLIKKAPSDIVKLAKLMQSKIQGGRGAELKGRGVLGNIVKNLGLVSLGAGAAAGGLYIYLRNNPMVVAKIAGHFAKEAIKESAGMGGGAFLPMNSGKQPYGVIKDPMTGKVKKNKYSVWNGIHPQTGGRLRKSDLMLKPGTNKVISKKKYKQGKMMQMQGKGFFK